MDANAVSARFSSVGFVIALLVLVVVVVLCAVGQMELWPGGAISAGLALAIMLR